VADPPEPAVPLEEPAFPAEPVLEPPDPAVADPPEPAGLFEALSSPPQFAAAIARYAIDGAIHHRMIMSSSL
jgi:hypothetical protein